MLTRLAAIILAASIPSPSVLSAGQRLHVLVSVPSGPVWYVASESVPEAVQIVARSLHPCSAIEHHEILETVGRKAYTVRVPGGATHEFLAGRYRDETPLADFGPLTEPPVVKTAGEWAQGKSRVVFFDKWPVDRRADFHPKER